MKLRRTRDTGWYEIASICPICGHKGWCRINKDQTVVHCMRVQSEHYFDSQIGRQYIHQLNEQESPITPPEIEDNHDVEKKPNDYLDGVYQTFLEESILSDFHLSALLKRKMTKKQIQIREYRSLPSQDRHKITKRVSDRLSSPDDLSGVPGFYVKEGKYGPYWTMAGASGTLIPFRSIYNEITGFQTRVDQPPLELRLKGSIKGRVLREVEKENGLRRAICELIIAGRRLEGGLIEKDVRSTKDAMGEFLCSAELVQGQKYYWWSSSNKLNGSSIGAPIPYHFALPSELMENWNYHNTPDKLLDCSEIWLTEGGLKADIASDALYKPFIGIPGLNSFSIALEPLKAIGCKHLVIAADADVTITPAVELALGNCVDFFANHTDMKISLAMWDISLAKGIDDLVSRLYVPQVTTLVG